MLLIIIIIFVAAATIYHYREIASEKELQKEIHFNHELSPRLCISVVVDQAKAKDIDYISTLLRQESNSFEVVIVGDFEQKSQLLHSIKRHFAMIRVNYIPTQRLPHDAIKSLYRSHKKLFDRLVVVDSPRSRSYTTFEVGAQVSRYDYNLQIHSRRNLRTHAIENLLLELSLYPEGSVETIVSRYYEGFKLITRDIALGNAKGSRGKKRVINYRILK